MRTLNEGVYECLCCGSVVEQELLRLPPFCCGIEMTKAGERAVLSDEVLVSPPVASRWVKTVGRQAAKYKPSAQSEFAA